MQAQVSRLLEIEPTDIAAAAATAGTLGNGGRQLDLTNLEAKKEAIDELAALVAGTVTGLTDVESESQHFQHDIRQLADEMRQLQQHSTTLHRRLQVRKQAAEKLGPTVSDLVVPPAIVQEICNGQIGPQWRAALSFVQRQTANRSGSAESLPLDRKSSADGSFSDKLLARACERIKEWYIGCVRQLRVPGSNCQSVQRELINNHALFEFLATREPLLALTIRRAYANTMRWYYEMLFGKYTRNIDRLPALVIDKTKTVGGLGATTHKSLFTSATSARSSDVFNIGSRPTILTSTDLALELGQQPPPNGHYIEAILRSLLLALHNSMELEQQVSEEAFPVPADKETPSDLFVSAKTSIAATFKRLTEDNFDLFGLMLALRILQNQPRDVPAFTALCDEREKALWTRIEVVLQTNAESIELARSKSSSYRSASHDIAPHPMTQLVAQLLTGVLQLCPDAEALDEPVNRGLGDLLAAYEAFVNKISESNPSRELFLYNNYFLLSALLGDVPGELAAKMAEHVRLLTDAYAPKTHS